MEHFQNNTSIVSRQFRRTRPDGSLSRGYGFWQDMAEPKTWHFLEQFLPGYDSDSGVNLSSDLSCIIDSVWSRRKFNNYYPEFKGYTMEELRKELEETDVQLYTIAEEYLEQALKEGEIKIRELPVTMVSARITGKGGNDQIWIQCADKTHSEYRKEYFVPSEDLQNVKRRVINKGTKKERFQVFYDRKGYWCNVQSFEFNVICHNMKIEIDRLREMWSELGDIPIDENECIETDFYEWPAGTDRCEIWHWFDEQCPKSLYNDLLFQNETI